MQLALAAGMAQAHGLVDQKTRHIEMGVSRVIQQVFPQYIGQIQLLEEQIGRPLFHKKGRKLEMTETDFAWITSRIKDVARRHAKGRIVSCLEGGYHLGALARSVEAHIRELQI